MSLAPGTRLGAYEIVALVGSGGMGEVYRAHDSRLGRDVAIKVLPVAFSEDGDRLARFEQEARAAAALNHPNVLSVFDVGAHLKAPYVVAELLDGATLRDTLASGPLPVRKAVEYAVQIARGLAAAHERGIVHRDLKPENIFITSDGVLKILDFGLAKLMQADQALSAGTNAPTSPAAHRTELGLVLGTMGYMSPEQVRGQPVDHRSDIFAFGAVLYEMLAGRRAFRGDTDMDTMMAIAKEAPPELELSDGRIPAALARIVGRCLEKNPAARFQSTRDLAFALEALTTASGGAVTAMHERSSHLLRTRTASGIAVVGLIFMAFAIGRYLVPAATKSPVESSPAARHVSIHLPEDAPLVPVGSASLGIGRPALALSPDGSRLAYVGAHESGTQLFVRSMSGFGVTPLPGTEGAYGPFFSPDGQWVAFFSGNQLKKIALAGGQPVYLCEATNAYGGTWADNDVIYFAPHEAASLWRVPAAGGKCESAVAPGGADVANFTWPHALPGGDVILVYSSRLENSSKGGIIALSLSTGEQKRLLETGGSAVYVSAGYLLYVAGGGLMGVRFDPRALSISGPAAPVLDGVRIEGLAAAQFAVALNGTLVYAPGHSASVGRFVWRDRENHVVPTSFPAAEYGSFTLSPNRSQLVVALWESRQLWIHEFAQGSRQRLTASDETGASPIWTQDGASITFQSGVQRGAVSQKPTDGTRTSVLVQGDYSYSPDGWSPDGRFLAVDEWHPAKSEGDVVVFDARDGKLHPLIHTAAIEWGAAFSPDGRYVAYTSDETGDYQVFVQPFPATGEKRQASATEGGNEEPVWSLDGRELFYRNGRRWIAVAVTTTPTLTIGAPHVLFEGDYLNVPGRSYDVARNGNFLLLEQVEPARQSDVNLIENWFGELKRLIPAR